MLVIHHCIAATLSSYPTHSGWCSGAVVAQISHSLQSAKLPCPAWSCHQPGPGLYAHVDTFNGHEDISLHGQLYDSMKVLRVDNRVTGHDRPVAGSR